jgi:fructokinase
MDTFAGIELGGTKIVCGLASLHGELLDSVRFATAEPQLALPKIHEELARLADDHGQFVAMGIGAFGPVDLDRHSATFGRIGRTPKTAWRGCDLLGFFRERVAVPIVLDTDVTAAAWGEARWGAAAGVDDVVYITVGTGIGGGVLIGGRPVHGLMHPEIGHVRVPRADGDDYPGGCPYHADCVEGLAAGPAIVARWGRQLGELPDGHAAFAQTAHYLAHLIVNVILFYAPRRIVLGGGVASNQTLHPMIRERVGRLLNRYFSVPEIEERIDELIVSPGLGDDAGVLGAIAMVLAEFH